VANHLTSRPLLVEFVGLPGVGKSHATGLVAADLVAVGIPVRSSALRINHELYRPRRVLRKFGMCAAEGVHSPRRAARVGRAVIGSGQQSPADVFRLLYNWLFIVGLLRRARTRPVVELLDEGIYQLLWSVGLAGGERVIRELSRTFLEGRPPAAPMPDVVVLVEAPLGVIEARLAARKSRAGRLDRMEGGERQAALMRGADLLHELLSEDVGERREAPGPLLRRVRNDQSGHLETDVAALVEELASLADCATKDGEVDRRQGEARRGASPRVGRDSLPHNSPFPLSDPQTGAGKGRHASGRPGFH
jgi:hypothetical protein